MGIVSRFKQLFLFDGKVCTRCGISKSFDDYYRDANRPDGYCAACKDCHKVYYRKNKDHITERNKTYERTHKERRAITRKAGQAANRERYNEWARRYAREHPETVRGVRERYRERKRVVDRKWDQQNPDRIRAKNQRRRARMAGAEGDHTAEEWQALRDWFGNACLVCGTTNRVSADHVLPLFLGGSNAIDNLQPLCVSCNSAKGRKHIDYRDPDMLELFLRWLEGDD